ncbi:hypothetical protein OJ996_03925 [Luteolibacter sp. GHJ8]|uniref:Uncharacterized protein n=1 Tax=Luteolibacter rhizosphaerae TaxID=2989719 RepID=A0ABT3FZ57_9BACT|nr:hypothetical protein [Luteolibacter rhizosphaerae]MCW1912707.1 hypothetical protein [Luteolibacter rhizosphaerae]
MIEKCLACGIEKDSSVKEIYPYPDQGLIDDPIDPFFTIDCQELRPGEESDWRVVRVCHECFHRMDPDMWISREGWESLEPVTPFETLPKLP